MLKRINASILIICCLGLLHDKLVAQPLLFEKLIHQEYDYSVFHSIRLPGGKILHGLSVSIESKQDKVFICILTDSLGEQLWKLQLPVSEVATFKPLSNGNFLVIGRQDYCGFYNNSIYYYIGEFDINGQMVDYFNRIILYPGFNMPLDSLKFPGDIQIGSKEYWVVQKNELFKYASNEVLSTSVRTELPNGIYRYVRTTDSGVIVGTSEKFYRLDTNGIFLDSLILTERINRFEDIGVDTFGLYIGNKYITINSKLEIISAQTANGMDALLQIAVEDSTIYYFGLIFGQPVLSKMSSSGVMQAQAFFNPNDFIPHQFFVFHEYLLITGLENTGFNHALLLSSFRKNDLVKRANNNDIGVVEFFMDSINYFTTDCLNFKEYDITARVRNFGSEVVHDFNVSFSSTGYSFDDNCNNYCDPSTLITTFKNYHISPGESALVFLGRVSTGREAGQYQSRACCWTSGPNQEPDAWDENDMACMNHTLLGSVELKPYMRILLAPNPADSYISFSGLKSPFSYQVFSIDGSLVQSGMADPTGLIDIKSLQSGLYMISMYMGTEHFSTKFLVER